MDKRFLTMLAAAAAAFSIGGALAADQARSPQPEAVQQNPAPNPASDNAGAQRDVLKEKDAYFAAMTKCDALKGVAEKQQCVDAVRKQYGQM